jgi:hypothetical protein
METTRRVRMRWKLVSSWISFLLEVFSRHLLQRARSPYRMLVPWSVFVRSPGLALRQDSAHAPGKEKDHLALFGIVMDSEPSSLSSPRSFLPSPLPILSAGMGELLAALVSFLFFLFLFFIYVPFVMLYFGIDALFSLNPELPPAKRRKGLAGSIVSTALSAALVGTAVGLTVYRL